MKRCDLTFVKATNRGGRLHSAVYSAKDLHNGTLGYLGGFVANSTEVRTFEKPVAGLISKKMPVIVMKPEINYDETKRLIGDFVNPMGKPFPVVPLEELDGFDLSEDYFNVATKDAPVGGGVKAVALGDMFIIKDGADTVGAQLEYIKTTPVLSAHACYFKVVGIRESHIANFIYDDGSATSVMFPKPYKMVALEVIRPTA